MALDLESGGIRQLTDIRTGDAPSEREPDGQRAFLVEQQKELFDFIDSEEFRGQPWNRSVERDTTAPKPFYVGRDRSAFLMRVTPDERFAVVTVRTNDHDATMPVQMPVWITDDGYVELYEGREKVGDQQATSRTAVIDLATGEATWVADSVGEGDRTIDVVDVASNSAHALVQVETHDREHRYWVVVDLPSMEERTVAHDHDPAWLGHPGPDFGGAGGFMPDGETVYFSSERTGWIHLWVVAAAGGDPRALTSGEWEVHDAELSRDGRTWYLTTNREGFADVHTYSMPANGGPLTQLTTASGRQEAAVSPDGRWMAIRHSQSNDPWELYVQEARAGRPMRQVTESTTEEFRSFAWRKPEIVMVPASDGVMVPARLHRPRGDVAPMGQRPAVIFVHGAGYLQNVHNWWSSYYREYMFHHVLAERGYTVLALDYRGSEGYGRDWRTAIYQHMGGKDLSDHVDAAAWLVEDFGVDPERIGIYGGSYGGFITLMAMFTSPGTFQAGAALRSVTDWAHYNHSYTSGILNEPQDDKDAYVRSSPIYHAEGLEGHLLMAHGMVDDNVLFYDIVRLTQRLIELGKEDWELAVYPAERHGFQLASSWADEYTRIFKLFERTLKD
jgi:dipeptidyl aminopeptidase/acylaminoacyl peptidase